jgi:hypothetical protein
LARIFEDIGVTAYARAAGLIQNNAILQTAAELPGTEAEHVGSIRPLMAMWGWSGITLDGVDVPPSSGKQYFSTDANALVRQRTAGQVLYLAYGMKANAPSGGFFPNGVNGKINMSTVLA